MISVALVSDVGKKTDGEQTRSLPFKAGQLGQLIILIELIGQVQIARHRKEETPVSSRTIFDYSSNPFKGCRQRFPRHCQVLGFSRVTVICHAGCQGLYMAYLFSIDLIESLQERNFLYPLSYRVLYCILFREIRLLTRSSKP